MNPETLVAFWSAPDNTRLTPKQYTFRLPTHVAAKIHALCDLYPAKNRTQIVADLLSSALTDIDKAMPVYEGESIGRHPDTDEELKEAWGPRVEFRARANDYFKEFEAELGNESVKPLYP